MGTLFTKQKIPPLNLLTLPSYCIPTKESNNLEAKRDAQLKWMRDKGMTYLGDPPREVAKEPPRRLTATSIRLVEVRKDALEAPDLVRAGAGEG